MARCLPATPLGPRVTLALPRGASLTYQESLDSSSKQPLVLLHGLGMTADLNWGATYAELSRLFRVVAPDLPGHGRGVHPWPNFSLEECADHIVALADSLGIDRFIACGYSMGSLVAQLVWRRHPDRVTGLVLGATSRNFLGSPAERLVSSLSPTFAVAAPYSSRLALPPFVTHDYDPSITWMAAARIASFPAGAPAAAGRSRSSSPT